MHFFALSNKNIKEDFIIVKKIMFQQNPIGPENRFLFFMQNIMYYYHHYC